MENINFDWLDNDYAFNYGTPEFPISGSPRASPAAEQSSPAANEPISQVANMQYRFSD